MGLRFGVLEPYIQKVMLLKNRLVINLSYAMRSLRIYTLPSSRSGQTSTDVTGRDCGAWPAQRGEQYRCTFLQLGMIAAHSRPNMPLGIRAIGYD